MNISGRWSLGEKLNNYGSDDTTSLMSTMSVKYHQKKLLDNPTPNISMIPHTSVHGLKIWGAFLGAIAAFGCYNGVCNA
jgi:hypothetical protein